MKTLLLLISSYLLLTATPIDYDIIIKDQFNNALFDVTQDNNDYVSAVGFTRVRTANSAKKSYTNAFEYLHSNSRVTGEQIRLIQLNDNAKITKDLTFKLLSFNRATSVIKTSNNDYYIGGYTLDGELILTRMKENGTTVFQTLFGTKNYDRMHQLVHLRDGGVLAVGSSITSRSFRDPLFSGGLGLNDIYLTRFSRDGQLLWTKKYGSIDDDNGISAVEAQDGSIMVIATTSKGKNKNIMLLRISEEGDKIWLKKYTNEGIYQAHNIIRLRDNTFLANVSVQKKNKQTTRLVIFDIQKNLIKDVEIKADDGFILNDIKQHADGTFSVAGERTIKGDVDAVAMRLDSSLNVMWEKTFKYPNYNTLNGLRILRNSDVVYVGTHAQYASEVSNMWIIKLRKDGEFVLIDSAYSSLYLALCKEFEDELSKNILHISKTLQIQFIDEGLKFKVGEYILTPYQEKFLLSFSDRLFAILNQYKTIIENIAMEGYTSKEWSKESVDGGYLKNSDLSSKRAHSFHTFIYLHVNKQDKSWLRHISKANANSYAKQLKIDSDNRDAREVSVVIEVKKRYKSKKDL